MTDSDNYIEASPEKESNKSRVWWIVLIVLLLLFICCCAAVLIFYYWLGDIILQIFNDISYQLGMNYY